MASVIQFGLWLTESWVEFSKLSTQVGEELASCSHRRDLSVSPPTAPSLANSSVERLLFEAQKESSGPSSFINSRASSQERLYFSSSYFELSGHWKVIWASPGLLNVFKFHSYFCIYYSFDEYTIPYLAHFFVSLNCNVIALIYDFSLL